LLEFHCISLFSMAQILFSHAPTAGTGDAKTEISVNPLY
jgi:hypothetical protein